MVRVVQTHKAALTTLHTACKNLSYFLPEGVNIVIAKYMAEGAHVLLGLASRDVRMYLWRVVVVCEQLAGLQVEDLLPLQLLHHYYWQVLWQVHKQGQQQVQHQRQEEQKQEEQQQQQQDEQQLDEACFSDQRAWLQPLHAGAALPACRQQRKKVDM